MNYKSTEPKNNNQETGKLFKVYKLFYQKYLHVRINRAIGTKPNMFDVHFITTYLSITDVYHFYAFLYPNMLWAESAFVWPKMVLQKNVALQTMMQTLLFQQIIIGKEVSACKFLCVWMDWLDSPRC